MMLKVKTKLKGTVNVTRSMLNDRNLKITGSIDRVKNGHILIQIINISEVEQKLDNNSIVRQATRIEENRMLSRDNRRPEEIKPNKLSLLRRQPRRRALWH